MKAKRRQTTWADLPLCESDRSAARWLVPSFIVLATCVAFLPVLSNQFVAWDDEPTLVANPYFRGLGWTQLKWMFTTFHMGPYQPLSWVTYGVDYLIWGMNPVGYHLTNLVLHAANAVFVYVLTRRLLERALSLRDESGWRFQASAAAAALLFAIHPLRVESVAWATERRDVLSGLFFLWTLYCYLRAAASTGPSRHRWLGTAVVVYLLSLLAKATAMTLPLVLILLDVYPLRQLGARPLDWARPAQRKVLWEKVPFLAVAAVFASVAWLGQHSAAAVMPRPQHDLAAWLGPPLFGLSFYVWKTLLPVQLSPLYEIPYYAWPWLRVYILSAVIVATVSAGFVLLRRRWPALLACWLYYVLLLLPVLGIVQIGPQLVADRYSYLSCLSWAVLAGGVVLLAGRPAAGRTRTGRIRRSAVAAAVVAVLCVLGLLTRRQAGVWHDTRTLWEYTIAVSPESSIARYNYGNLLLDLGEVQPALESYRRSVLLNPVRAAPRFALARVLAGNGQSEEAAVNFREALRIDPLNADGHYALGSLLGMRGSLEESRRHLEQAVALKPDHAGAHANLGDVYRMLGKAPDAISQYRTAIDVDPNLDDARLNLGQALLQSGDTTGAARQFELVVTKRPHEAEPHYLLGCALAAGGRLAESAWEFREALRLNPSSANGYLALARALAATGQTSEAARYRRQGLALQELQAPSPPQRR
jgi:tetratricopeptide (TPR) repeat protein